ncbi:MAG: hypothetical protein ABEK36_01370 [Candidatus Aenigmatarchaeota archaeon]
MKGQINIQYLIALVVFIGLIWYLTFQITSMIPDFKIESQRNILNSKAYRLTEIMVKTGGVPSNWNTSNVKSFGLAKSPNNLNSTKVQDFRNMCNHSYGKVRDIFQSSNKGNEISDFHFSLKMGGAGFECGRRIPKSASTTVVSVKRRVILSGTLRNLELVVW